MSAVILRFPKSGRLPRAAIEAMIEQLIDLLDDQDTPTVDCEPEVNEDSDGTGVTALPDRHGSGSTPLMLRLVFGNRHSFDGL